MISSDNRWAKLAQRIPWFVVNKKYAENFIGRRTGNQDVESRITFGALIIKQDFNLLIGLLSGQNINPELLANPSGSVVKRRLIDIMFSSTLPESRQLGGAHILIDRTGVINNDSNHTRFICQSGDHHVHCDVCQHADA